MELPDSITVHKVNIDVDKDEEKLNQKYPPLLLAMAPALLVPIGPGDTIEFAGDSIDEFPFQFSSFRPNNRGDF